MGRWVKKHSRGLLNAHVRVTSLGQNSGRIGSLKKKQEEKNGKKSFALLLSFISFHFLFFFIWKVSFAHLLRKFIFKKVNFKKMYIFSSALWWFTSSFCYSLSPHAPTFTYAQVHFNHCFNPSDFFFFNERRCLSFLYVRLFPSFLSAFKTQAYAHPHTDTYAQADTYHTPESCSSNIFYSTHPCYQR